MQRSVEGSLSSRVSEGNDKPASSCGEESGEEPPVLSITQPPSPQNFPVSLPPSPENMAIAYPPSSDGLVPDFPFLLAKSSNSFRKQRERSYVGRAGPTGAYEALTITHRQLDRTDSDAASRASSSSSTDPSRVWLTSLRDLKILDGNNIDGDPCCHSSVSAPAQSDRETWRRVPSRPKTPEWGPSRPKTPEWGSSQNGQARPDSSRLLRARSMSSALRAQNMLRAESCESTRTTASTAPSTAPSTAHSEGAELPAKTSSRKERPQFNLLAWPARSSADMSGFDRQFENLLLIGTILAFVLTSIGILLCEPARCRDRKSVV